MEPKLNGYAALNKGFLVNTHNDRLLVTTANLGLKIEKDGLYGEIKGGYGTATQVKIEAGKDFTFGESSFGLNASVAGQYTTVNNKKYSYNTVDVIGDSSWKSNDTRGYGQLALTYNKPAFKAKIGVQAGVKTSSQPELNGYSNLTNISDVYKPKITKAIVNPTFGLEAGKKLKGTLDLSLDCFTIGGKWCF